MRKLVFSMALLMCLSSFGQVEFGVRAGLNLPTLTGDDTDNLSSFATYHAGAFANIEVSDNFSVQPECMFSCQGADYEESEGYDGRFELAYINVPVMAQFEVTPGLCLEAGPQVGFLLSAEDQYDAIDFEDSGTEDIKDELKSIDFGLNFGASYAFGNGLAVGARYNLGLSNIVDSEDFDGEIKNGVFQFSVAYTIFGRNGGDDGDD